MAITDNRTSMTTNDATGLDDLTGVAGGAVNTETFIEGTGSQSLKVSNAKDGLLYDFGASGDYSGNTFYFWYNCSTGGLLDIKANGGVAIRFCGATVSDWFEVYIQGSDTYSGGFRMAVIDIDEAHTNADATNGTKPATSAIRYAGVVFNVASMISGNVDNCFWDAMWRLPAATPGIIVTGQNTGSVDWTWQDLVDAGDVGDPTKAWGTIRLLENGTVSLNTPVRFGANDTVTHGFSDTNVTVGFESSPGQTGELIPDDFYFLDALGNTGGTTNFALGLKTGTGNDATGAQGGAIQTAGPRFAMDFNDPDLDSIDFYGVTLSGGAAFVLDDAAVEMISCIILDCTSALVSNSLFLRNTVINANTADGVAFLQTDDFGDVRFCTFQFSDGHAIELVTPRIASQTSTGNTFTGYTLQAGNANDRSIYNNTAGLVDISVVSGGSATEHSYRDGATGPASTTVTANLSVSFTNFAVGTEIKVFIDSTGAQEDGIETTVADPWIASLQSGVAYNIVAIYPGYVPIRIENQTYTADGTVNLNQQVDRNFENN